MIDKIYEVLGEFITNNEMGLKDILFISGCAITILTIMLLIVMIKQLILSSKYKKFMMGSDARSLEEEIRERMNIIDNLDSRLNAVENDNTTITTRLNEVFQKIGIIKYDAFEEMGGKMSFALALLSDNDTGFIINAMHSREGCYTYIKEINNGQSSVLLAKEEKEALEAALLSEIQK